jgi:phosphomannomutase
MQKSVTLPGSSGAERIKEIMGRLRCDPPHRLGTLAVASFWDLQSRKRRYADGVSEEVTALVPNDTVIIVLEDGSRIAVRPSGTEPKIKLYLEVAERAAAGDDPDAIESRGNARLSRLLGLLLEETGLAGEV